MKDFFKGLRVNYSVSALLCVLLGVVLLIWPGMTTQLVCIILGIVLLAYGILQVALYLFNRDRTILSQGMLIFGIIVSVIGAWILFNPGMILAAIPVIVGVLIVIHGIHNVVQAISLMQEGYGKWWLACIFGVLTVVLGGILIFRPFTVIDTVVRLIGIFLIYDGLSDIWILSRVSRVKKQADRIIDAEFVDVEDDR